MMAAHEARRGSSMIQVRFLTIILLRWRPVAIIRHFLASHWVYSTLTASTVATADHSRRWLILLLVIDAVGKGWLVLLLILSHSNPLSAFILIVVVTASPLLRSEVLRLLVIGATGRSNLLLVIAIFVVLIAVVRRRLSTVVTFFVLFICIYGFGLRKLAPRRWLRWLVGVLLVVGDAVR